VNVRRLVAVAAATLAVTLLVSSSGFSTVNADRGVSVSVADDSEAFVGVETHSPEIAGAGPETVTLLTVENNFGDSLSVTATIVDGGDAPPPFIKETRLETAEPFVGQEDVNATVHCSNSSSTASVAGPNDKTETVDVRLTVTGSSVRVEMTRSVTVTCTDSSEHGTKSENGADSATETDSKTESESDTETEPADD